jgi:hypothetical protein
VKKAFKMIGILAGVFVLGVIALLVVDISNDDEQAAGKENTEVIQGGEWEETIKEIASTDKTTTEKFDEASAYANDYNITDEELAAFEDFIINEFTSGNYLADLENHEYMLSNIFKAHVIERKYDDNEQEPIDQFAFDFLQNAKYTYRGVDVVDSESVLSNEEQMNEIVSELK